jgi:phosphohistidine phosphatase
MKNLILLRHAKSDWSDLGLSTSFGHDRERPLSDRGQKACKKISKVFASMRVRVDLVEYSSAKRAIETFNLIKHSLSFSACQLNSELYTFNWLELRNVISKKSDEIGDFLIVGHNPAIEDLIANLVPKEDNSEELIIMRDKFPTGGLAFLKLNILQWSGLEENCASLKNFFRPKDIIK